MMPEGGDNEFVDKNLDDEFSGIETKGLSKAGQAGLEIVGAGVPFVGGLMSWIAGAWSGAEQDRANAMFIAWFKMIQEEMREKYRVMAELMSRLDMQDEKITDRVTSPEYQTLVRKAFRNWNSTQSEEKQRIVRNILANAAAARTTSDDVVSLFLDWIANYSEFHFEVIGAIYNAQSITRGGIWRKLGKPTVREDSADADLFKLLIRDLSTGSVIRQHRETDYAGNFIKKSTSGSRRGEGSTQMKSAFDDEEEYELTELGKQFVHYAMNELAPRIGFDPDSNLNG